MAEDRTSEFLSLAKNLPSSRAGGGGNSTLVTSGPSSGRYGRPDSAYAQLKDFHSTAGTISRDIAATSALLGELTQLVRQKSLFVDDSQRVNGLVMQIKSSIENLNGRLEEAGTVIAQQKRQLGKNSQAGQEASNLVGQLKEEFVQATAGFKKVLQQRTDTLKETSDRKRQVYGGGIGSSNNNNNGREEYSLNLQNKPPVYYDQEDDNPMPNMSSMGPMLDLTSGMSAGEPTSSSANLPRPRKSLRYLSVVGKNCHFRCVSRHFLPSPSHNKMVAPLFIWCCFSSFPPLGFPGI
jgi:hypothetical protein